jgi:hypothetical protein
LHNLGEISQVKVEETILFVLTEKMLSLKTNSSFTYIVPDPHLTQITIGASAHVSGPKQLTWPGIYQEDERVSLLTPCIHQSLS